MPLPRNSFLLGVCLSELRHACGYRQPPPGCAMQKTLRSSLFHNGSQVGRHAGSSALLQAGGRVIPRQKHTHTPHPCSVIEYFLLPPWPIPPHVTTCSVKGVQN